MAIVLKHVKAKYPSQLYVATSDNSVYIPWGFWLSLCFNVAALLHYTVYVFGFDLQCGLELISLCISIYWCFCAETGLSMHGFFLRLLISRGPTVSISILYSNLHSHLHFLKLSIGIQIPLCRVIDTHHNLI